MADQIREAKRKIDHIIIFINRSCGFDRKKILSVAMHNDDTPSHPNPAGSKGNYLEQNTQRTCSGITVELFRFWAARGLAWITTARDITKHTMEDDVRGCSKFSPIERFDSHAAVLTQEQMIHHTQTKLDKTTRFFGHPKAWEIQSRHFFVSSLRTKPTTSAGKWHSSTLL